MLLFISYHFINLIFLKQVNGEWVSPKTERRGEESGRKGKCFHPYSITASMKTHEVLEHKILWFA